MAARKSPSKKKPAAKQPAVKRAPRVKAEAPPADLAEELGIPESFEGGYIPINLLLKYDAFVQEYLATGNAAESSSKAGFLASSPDRQKEVGFWLLQKPDVRLRLKDQYELLLLRHKATPDRVWAELQRMAFCDPGTAYDEDGEPLPMPDIPEDTRRAITGYKVVRKTFGEDGESVEKEVKFGGKDGAIDKLIKLHGMVKENSLTIVAGDDFLKALNEGRERAAASRRG